MASFTARHPIRGDVATFTQTATRLKHRRQLLDDAEPDNDALFSTFQAASTRPPDTLNLTRAEEPYPFVPRQRNPYHGFIYAELRR